jgi:hypothetical protein
MTNPGRSICIFESVRFSINITYLFILSFPLVSFACAIQAPEDYYFQFSLMEEWGKYNRRETGRAPSTSITHPENAEPLIVAFEVGEPASGWLGFVPYKMTDVELVGEGEPSIDVLKPKVPISLQQEALRQMFQEQEIQAVHWRLNDGRLKGEHNIVQIHFIPSALSDQAIKKEFLMICAIVHGAQTQGNTVDVIKGIIEREDGTPRMIVETQITDYVAYLREQIDKAEWETQVKLRRF